ncbi:MAG: ribonuclease III [Muribaculaceae bacterium]|nr:ribonuclease III [Muribaculaceae bacterium]
MVLPDAISLIKLLFIKDKELYVYLHSVLGFYPRNIELYRLALVHRSKQVKLRDGQWADNERLEYLGDAVLDLVVADFLYNAFPSHNEGFLTSTRAKIVQRESLNRVGQAMRLESHVQAAAHSNSHHSFIAGNALEAIVGAIYLDRGYHACHRFITRRIIKEHFDIDELIKVDPNYKSRLIEWTQKHRVSIDFELVETTYDKDNNPIFRTAVMIGGLFAADDTGYSKKESHQGASRKALERLDSDINFKQQVLSTGSA